MRYELRFVHGVRAGQRVFLDDNQTVVLGRGTETNCRIQDPSISRRHCQITNCPQGLLIADLGSSNGTFVNGQPVTHWRALNPNDQVVLGHNQVEIQMAQPMAGAGMAPPVNQAMSQVGMMGMGQPGMGQPGMPQPAMGGANPYLANASQNFQGGLPQQQSFAQPNLGMMQQSFAQPGMGMMQQSFAGGQPPGPAAPPPAMVATQGPRPDFDPNMVEGYIIESKLGQGAFGAVYKAISQRNGHMVALKTIRPQLVQNEKDVRRFFREAGTGATLVHPNIIRIYDAGESRGCHYIAMEFVDGRDVNSLIEQYGRIDIGYTLRVGIQIANALQHAYERSIVHRDIKPENILVTAQGQAKLVDFGLAKNFQQAGVSGLTAPGEGMGTLAYMPPEQLDNALMADQRSDIYSLGATLYHMLTGQRPFNEKTTRKFIMKILNEMPVPIREQNPQVPQELEQIIDKAMSKEPEDRYQTPAEMERELNEVFETMRRSFGR